MLADDDNWVKVNCDRNEIKMSPMTEGTCPHVSPGVPQWCIVGRHYTQTQAQTALHVIINQAKYTRNTYKY